MRASTGIDIGLWPAVRGHEAGPDFAKRSRSKTGMDLPCVVAAAAQDGNGGKGPRIGHVMSGRMPDGSKVTTSLPAAVKMALWPQSSARDWKGAKASAATMERNSRPCNEVVFSTWSAALRASDREKGGPRQKFRGRGGSPLPSQIYQTALSSSNARTTNSAGSLHPEFAGWEMGYPPEWLDCAPSAIASTRRSRRK